MNSGVFTLLTAMPIVQNEVWMGYNGAKCCEIVSLSTLKCLALFKSKALFGEQSEEGFKVPCSGVSPAICLGPPLASLRRFA